MDSVASEELIKLNDEPMGSKQTLLSTTDFTSSVSKNQEEKQLDKGLASPDSQGKENSHKDQRFCHRCNKSLTKSKHLINIAGQTHKWHPECFKCTVCHQPMDRASSCYIYKDKIVCRDDYFKLQQDNSIKCSRCRWPIGASDWVRKAGSFVYHLACFSCDICLRQLSTGEQFTVNIQERNMVRLLCRLHFAIDPPQSSTTAITMDANHLAGITTPTPGPFEFTYRQHNSAPTNNKFTHGHNQSDQQQQYLHLLASTSQAALLLDRKSELISSEDLNADESQLTGGQNLIGGSTSTSSSAGSSSALGSGLPSKSKRVRTTFTEDQLSILQTHFQIDSNPDGQDLERIATITGLSKRVTQVWFQNSRARQKKYMIKRKPSSASSSTSALVSASIGLPSGGSSNQYGAGVSSGSHHHHSRAQLRSHEADGVVESSAEGDCYQQKWSNLSDRSDVSMVIEDDISRASSSPASSISSSINGQLIVSDDNSNE